MKPGYIQHQQLLFQPLPTPTAPTTDKTAIICTAGTRTALAVIKTTTKRAATKPT